MGAGGLRRVSVIEARHERSVAPVEDRAGRGQSPPSERRDHLLRTLAELSELIRTGAFDHDPDDGVLIDTVLGRTRCVLVLQQPSHTVNLSPREQQIAAMVARGRTNQAIASALNISVWTVATYISRIFAKLAVSSRAEMVAHLRSARDEVLLSDGPAVPRTPAR